MVSEAIDKSEMAEIIIRQHESIQARPAMYFGSEDNVDAAVSFFAGYHAAAFAFYGIGETYSIAEFYREAVVSRGWELRAASVAVEMRERGISDKEIVAEIVDIQLDAWKIFFSTHLS